MTQWVSDPKVCLKGMGECRGDERLVFVFQLNVIFLGIALYKMFHHTAILKPDSGCLDNVK